MSTAENITINRLLNAVAERRATDIHFVVGNYPFIRVKGKLVPLEGEALITPEAMQGLINFFIPEERKAEVEAKKELKYIYDWLGKARFRVHIFQQKGFYSVSLKLIIPQLKSLHELGLPDIVANFLLAKKGIIFIVGPFNSGRSTTLSAMIQNINHILYLEEPVEHLFVNDKSVIEQREVGVDVKTFSEGLRSAKDEDVNIVAISRVDEPETLELLLELAESGRLVIAILDYYSAVTALDGMVSKFADAKVPWARNVLADFLVGIIVQRLIPTIAGELILAVEILTASPSVKALIKEGRYIGLESIIQTSRAEGMVSLERSLVDLVKQGKISAEEAASNDVDSKAMAALIRK